MKEYRHKNYHTYKHKIIFQIFFNELSLKKFFLFGGDGGSAATDFHNVNLLKCFIY